MTEVVCQNSYVDFLHAWTQIQPLCDPTMAEAQAALLVAKQALLLGPKKMILEGDSLAVINTLQPSSLSSDCPFIQ